jgi:hypothetical protein
MKLGNSWDNLLFALAVLVIAVIVARILRLIIGGLVKGASRKLKVGDPTKYNFLKNAVEFIVYIVAVIIIFRSIPQLESYGTALFASAGVIAAMQIMESEALLHPLCQDNRTAEEKTNDLAQVDMRLLNFTESGQLLRACVWASDPTEGFNMKCDLHKSIKKDLTAKEYHWHIHSGWYI